MARGQQETLDALRAFTKECEAFIREHKSTFKGEGRHRVMFEGIATWPYLRATYSPLAHSGVNVTSCVYGPSFTFSYDNFDGMIEKYCSVPNSTNLERSTDLREQLCLEGKVDGGLVHINRSCKMWSSFAPEMARRISRAGNDSVLHDAAKGHVSHVVRLAQESAAVGVVLLLAKFCDPEEFDAPHARKGPQRGRRAAGAGRGGPVHRDLRTGAHPARDLRRPHRLIARRQRVQQTGDISELAVSGD